LLSQNGFAVTSHSRCFLEFLLFCVIPAAKSEFGARRQNLLDQRGLGFDVIEIRKYLEPQTG